MSAANQKCRDEAPSILSSVSRLLAVLAVTMTSLVAVSAPSVRADDWNNPAGGNFGDDLNWLDGTAPTLSDSAEFNLGAGPYTVTLTQNQTVNNMVVHNDAVDFDLGGFTLAANASFGFIAGFNQNDVATVNISNGTFHTGSSSTIGRVSNVTTQVTLSGANTLWDSSTLTIGSSSGADNSVIIENGAHVTANSWTLGDIPGGAASLTITGSGSQFTGTSLLVGNAHGLSTVTVADGALVTTSLQTKIDPATSGTTTVHVTGENAILRGTGTAAVRVADVGTTGTVALAVDQGGSVQFPDMEVGHAVGTTGQVTVGTASGGMDAIINISDSAFIGRGTSMASDTQNNGDGELTVNAGGQFLVANDLYLGNNAAAGSGTLNVTGGLVTLKDVYIRPSGTLNFTGGEIIQRGELATSGDLVINGGTPGDNPTLSVTQALGPKVVSGDLYIAGDSGGAGNPGTVNLSAGTLNTTGDTYVYAGGLLDVESPASLNTQNLIAEGTVDVNANVFSGLVAQHLSITGTLNWTLGRIAVLGPQGLSTDDLPGNDLVVPESGVLDVTQAITVTSGETITIGAGTVNADVLNVGTTGAANDPTSTVVVDGSVPQLNVSSDTYLGGDSTGAGNPGELVASSGGHVDVGGAIKIWDNGTLVLDGGVVTADSIDNTDGGNIDFVAGSLTVNSGIGIGTDAFSHSISLGSDQVLITPATTSVAEFRTLTLAGGVLQTGGLVVDGTLQFDSGTLNITGAGGMTVGASGPFGASLSLGAGQHLDVTNTLTVDAGATLALTTGGNLTAGGVSNSGIILGSGSINAALSNQVGGEVRAAQGELLQFADAAHTNSGDIQLQGGRVDFGGSLINTSTGNILGRGTLDVSGAGLTNEGDLAFSNGQTDVFGIVNNQTTGRVIVSGNADVTFWDDVTHSGTLFNVSLGSSVTFFGNAGFSVSGGGDVFFEDDINAGGSPSLEAFGGDVYFGATSNLAIEVNGLTAGSEYDQLAIAGDASLGGTLDVAVDPLFTPQPGDSFSILSYGSHTGEFDTITGLNVDGMILSPVYDANELRLVVLLPGDANGDGHIDGLDYLVWAANYGSHPGADGDTSDGDFNDDGWIDGLDYLLWAGNYGQGPLDATAVPEPASLGTLLLGISALVFRRRKRAH